MGMAKSRDFGSVFTAAIAAVVGRNFAIEMIHDPDVILTPGETKPADMSPKPVSAATVEPTPAPVSTPESVAVEPEVPRVSPADDVASEDDPISTTASGVDLVTGILGGTIIDEYDEKTRK
jgi:hypothetical protein